MQPIELLQRTAAIIARVPEIALVGHPALRTSSAPVELEEGRIIAARLGEVLLRYRALTGLGRGLAAPQIGLTKAVFVTFVDDTLHTYINPHVVRASKSENTFRELCISSGVMWCEVIRPESISLCWTDETGTENAGDFDGLLSRLLQHENDHLHGMVNLDRATRGSITYVSGDPSKEELRKIN